MTTNQSKHKINPNHIKIALIYNPHAGAKRKLIPSRVPPVTLEDIKDHLAQYQIPVDYHPTKYAGHATLLAKELSKDYPIILAAGGDGTVGEVANGLVNTDTTLGIIPLGSFMNVAKMLSIPTEIEKAVALIKIGRTRKIDMGCVTQMDGKALPSPYYFLESAGIGMEAQIHEYILQLEKGDKSALIRMVKTVLEYYSRKTTLVLDQKVIETKAIMIAVSNGPYTGANLAIAPKAKLNDHLLTVTQFKMTKWEFFNYFFKLIRAKRRYSPKVSTSQAKEVEIKTTSPRSVHADARIFGQTPVKFTIAPSVLNVITGFPKTDEPSSLLKRTYLD